MAGQAHTAAGMDDELPTYEEAVRGLVASSVTVPSAPPVEDSRPVQPSPVFNPAWISSQQIVATFGTYGTEPGKFRTPVAVAQCPRSDNYVISDMGNRRVQIWSPEFQHIRSFGEMCVPPGHLKYPCGVAVAENGNIYVADTGNCHVAIFDSVGRSIGCIGGKGKRPGHFMNPYGLAIGPNRLLYVCDGDNFRIQAFRLDGTLASECCSRPENIFRTPPRDIAVYDNGVLAVTNWTNCVDFFSARGAYRNTWCGKQGAAISCAGGVAVTPRYDMFLVDRDKSELQICKANKEIVICGTPGSQPGCFKNPRGALYTREGNLVVVDSGNDRIQVLKLL